MKKKEKLRQWTDGGPKKRSGRPKTTSRADKHYLKIMPLRNKDPNRRPEQAFVPLVDLSIVF